eukprot:TRINITY_DN19011_c0_g2_i1.p1 TRINITY_DN19011_c0_g2~~TRINITY_DN19011_c0_g2_i1.p1  ORF type:complete len:607 (-),score=61.24 TRINITY_DN19011_c0_g2_i1:74-1894(-)
MLRKQMAITLELVIVGGLPYVGHSQTEGHVFDQLRDPLELCELLGADGPIPSKPHIGLCPFKTSFWRIAKNAGTELMEGWLMRNLCEEHLGSSESGEKEVLFGFTEVTKGCTRFFEDSMSSCGRTGASHWFNFTVLRNPWKRAQSVYGHMIRHGGKNRFGAGHYARKMGGSSPSLVEFLSLPDSFALDVHGWEVHTAEQVVTLFRDGAFGRLSFVAHVESLQRDMLVLRSRMNAVERMRRCNKRNLWRLPLPNTTNLHVTPKELKAQIVTQASNVDFDDAVRYAFPLDTAILGYTNPDDALSNLAGELSPLAGPSACKSLFAVPLQPAVGCEIFVDRLAKVLVVQPHAKSFVVSGQPSARTARLPGGLGGPFTDSSLIRSRRALKRIQRAVMDGNYTVVGVVQHPLRRLRGLYRHFCYAYLHCNLDSFHISKHRFGTADESSGIHCATYKSICQPDFPRFLIRVLERGALNMIEEISAWGLRSEFWRVDSMRCLFATGAYKHLDIVVRAEGLVHVNKISGAMSRRPLMPCDTHRCGELLKEVLKAFYPFDSALLMRRCYNDYSSNGTNATPAGDSSRRSAEAEWPPPICYSSVRARTRFRRLEELS